MIGMYTNTTHLLQRQPSVSVQGLKIPSTFAVILQKIVVVLVCARKVSDDRHKDHALTKSHLPQRGPMRNSQQRDAQILGVLIHAAFHIDAVGKEGS